MTAPGFRRTAFAGALAALLFAVACTPGGDGDFKLQGGDEMKPERILRKHRLGANVSDRRIARAAYDDAVAMRAGKAPSEVAWGPVAKAMCISALLHPKPSALVGCADASVQGLKYTEDALTRVELENVLERVRMRLTSALVLDEIARELTPQQRAAAETDRDCISDYLEHRGR